MKQMLMCLLLLTGLALLPIAWTTKIYPLGSIAGICIGIWHSIMFKDRFKD